MRRTNPAFLTVYTVRYPCLYPRLIQDKLLHNWSLFSIAIYCRPRDLPLVLRVFGVGEGHGPKNYKDQTLNVVVTEV
jgi:hypothetical protein